MSVGSPRAAPPGRAGHRVGDGRCEGREGRDGPRAVAAAADPLAPRCRWSTAAQTIASGVPGSGGRSVHRGLQYVVITPPNRLGRREKSGGQGRDDREINTDCRFVLSSTLHTQLNS